VKKFKEHAMRVVIWADMEGVAGIAKLEQVKADSPYFEEGRKLYTEEINAAIRGAKKTGCKEIIVIDGHGEGFPFCNLIKEKLESGAEYVFGPLAGKYGELFSPPPDALILIGAHAMEGAANGVLAQTMCSEHIYQILLNDKPIGEIGIRAGIAASFNVPLVFISGDQACIKEAQELVGSKLPCAEVKKGFGKTTAKTLAPSDACAIIEKGVHSTLKNQKSWPKVVKFPSPCVLKVEFSSPDASKDFANRPGCEISGARTVISRAKTLLEAWMQFWQS
jgi:D-amino peptidase